MAARSTLIARSTNSLSIGASSDAVTARATASVATAVADGIDCSYLCDIVVHPDHQGRGLGRAIVVKLEELSAGHRKIILYANPGKEGFYRKLGFRRMRTAMAIFQDQDRAIREGLVDDT